MKALEYLSGLWRSLDSPVRLRAGYFLIAVLTIAMAWSALAEKVSGIERKRIARENVLKELMSLKGVHAAARSSFSTLSGRLSAVRPDDTPAKIIEETGIRGKGIKIVPLKGEESNGLVEDAADLRLDGLTANETINLLYRLENNSRPLLIKKANLKVRYDDPSRFDLQITVALLKQAAAPAR